MDQWGFGASWGLGMRLVHGPLHKGGGGGDGGAAQRAADEAARKDSARKAVNKIFGYGEATGGTRTPIYEQRPVAGASSGGASSQIDISEADAETTGGRALMRRARRADPDATDSGGNPATENVVVGYNETPGEDPSATRAAREAQIQGIAQSNLDLNKTALDEQKAEAARRLKFSLARAGQRGGSTDVFNAGKLQKQYSDNIRSAIAGSDEIAANLRTADEEARLRLLGQVEAGADQGALLAGAANTLQSNVDRANAAAKGTILTGAFDNIGKNIGGIKDSLAIGDAQKRVQGGGALFGNAASTYQGT